MFGKFGRQVLALQDVLQRTGDEGQRRTQFVRDIGEELQLHVGQLLFDLDLMLETIDDDGDADDESQQCQGRQNLQCGS